MRKCIASIRVKGPHADPHYKVLRKKFYRLDDQFVELNLYLTLKEFLEKFYPNSFRNEILLSTCSFMNNYSNYRLLKHNEKIDVK